MEGGLNVWVEKRVLRLRCAALRMTSILYAWLKITSFLFAAVGTMGVGGEVGGVEGAEEGTGAGDGGVGAFHSFDGDAGTGGDDDGLAEVEGCDCAGDGAAVSDVGELVLVGGAGGEGAGFGEQGLEVLGGADELDAFVGEDLGDGAEEHVGVAGAEVEEEFGEAPVGADGGEDLLVLDLSGHGGAGDAFGFEGIDEAGELAEGEPVEVDVGVLLGAGGDLGVGLLLDGSDDDGKGLSAGGVEEEEGEAAVAGDEAELACTVHARGCRPRGAVRLRRDAVRCGFRG